MLGIMLVDDEKNVRSSIRSKIDWRAARFEIVAEAGSGSDALKLLKRKHHPQVIISDLRMPQMDGISFMKQCRDQYPGLRLVALSGYSDFEYLREAVRLGVKDYLLKPVARDELQGLLTKLAAELLPEEGTPVQKKQLKTKAHAASEGLRRLQEHYLQQLVMGEWYSTGAVKERLARLGLTSLAQDDLREQFAAIELVLPAEWRTQRQERRMLLYERYAGLCREAAASGGRVYPFRDPENPARVYFFIIGKKGREPLDKQNGFLGTLQAEILEGLKLQSIAGLGNEHRGLKGWKSGFASALSDLSRNGGDGVVCDSSRLPSVLPAFSSGTQRRLSELLETCEPEPFHSQLTELITADSADGQATAGNLFMALRVVLQLVSTAGKYASEGFSLQKYLWNHLFKLSGVDSRNALIETLDELAGLVMTDVQKTADPVGTALAEAVRKYVQENCGYALKADMIAAKYHWDTGELSRIFKRHVGSSIGDYANDLRMAQAGSLLQENELRLTEIIQVLGYADYAAFSAPFKKRYGRSPKAYREHYWKKHSES